MHYSDVDLPNDGVTKSSKYKESVSSVSYCNRRGALSLGGMFNSNKWLVRNVNTNASTEEICDFFGKFGEVKYVQKGQKCQSNAFVTFVEEVGIEAIRKEDLLFKNKYLIATGWHMKQNANSSTNNGDAHNEELPTFIHFLPDEMLDLIFSFLNVPERIRTESVCRRWRAIGTKLAWRSPVRLEFNEELCRDQWHMKAFEMTDEVMSSILSRCGQSLEELVLYRLTGVSLEDAKLIGKYCPNLKKIGISGFWKNRKVDKSVLMVLASHCPKVKHVSLDFFGDNDEILREFLDMCPNLERLELKGMIDMSGKFLGESGKNLKILKLERCTNILSMLAHLQIAKSKITVLTLDRVALSVPVLLLKAVSHFKDSLQVLRLERVTMMDFSYPQMGMEQVTSDLIKTLTVVNSLEVLSLSGSRFLNNKALEVLATSCRLLRVLVVASTFVTDKGVAALSLAPSLKVVDISCTNVSGSGIATLARQGLLEELYIYRLFGPDKEAERGCLPLAKYCPNLRILDARSNKNVTSKLIKAFQSSVKRGFLQASNVKLAVGNTSVQKGKIEDCDGLEVLYDISYHFEVDNYMSSYYH